MFNDFDEITRAIYKKYKPALRYIGVDFSREDVQEAINNCSSDMETRFQAVIAYWKYKKQKKEQFYGNASLIDALNNSWQPINWKDSYLDDKRFKSPCVIWWEEVAKVWGETIRNDLIADVNETNNGEEYILLKTGEKISLEIAEMRGMKWVLAYAQERQKSAYEKEIEQRLYLQKIARSHLK